MSGQAGFLHNCRECRTNLTGLAYIRLGKGTLKGSTGICLACVDKMMTRDHHKTVRDFTVSYIAAHRTERQTVQALSDRVAELEKLLEQVTRPNGQGQPVYTTQYTNR